MKKQKIEEAIEKAITALADGIAPVLLHTPDRITLTLGFSAPIIIGFELDKSTEDDIVDLVFSLYSEMLTALAYYIQSDPNAFGQWLYYEKIATN